MPMDHVPTRHFLHQPNSLFRTSLAEEIQCKGQFSTEEAEVMQPTITLLNIPGTRGAM